MCSKRASTFGQLPFFSYFCSHYDNTERLLQYYTSNMDNLRTIDLCPDALHSCSIDFISAQCDPYDSYGILTVLLQSTCTYYCSWR